MKKALLTAGVFVACLASTAAAEATLAGSIRINADNTLSLVDAQGQTVSGASFSGTYTVKDGTIVTTSDSQLKVDTPANFISMQQSFSISFKANWNIEKERKWPSILAFGEANDYNYTIRANGGANPARWEVFNPGYNGTGEIGGPLVVDYTSVPVWGEHNYVLTMETSEEGYKTPYYSDGKKPYSSIGTRTFTLYQDNVKIFQFTDSGRVYGSPNDMVFSFGGHMTKPNSDAWYSTADAISEVKFYNGVLTVPEPTTATLSLLALAGLAARRRRK